MSRATHLAVMLALVGVFAAATAWRVRDRIAVDGHQSMWAMSSLLCGVLHVVVCLMLIPVGCTSTDALTAIVASALPWVLAAGLFRTGVAPIPPELHPDYSRSERSKHSGPDPFQ